MSMILFCGTNGSFNSHQIAGSVSKAMVNVRFMGCLLFSTFVSLRMRLEWVMEVIGGYDLDRGVLLQILAGFWCCCSYIAIL